MRYIFTIIIFSFIVSCSDDIPKSPKSEKPTYILTEFSSTDSQEARCTKNQCENPPITNWEVTFFGASTSFDLSLNDTEIERVTITRDYKEEQVIIFEWIPELVTVCQTAGCFTRTESTGFLDRY
jgi:hypothetical protein